MAMQPQSDALGFRAQARLRSLRALLSADPKSHGGYGMVIKAEPGESEPQATLRVLKSLPADLQERLRLAVDWIEDYGFGDETQVVPSASRVAPNIQITRVREAASRSRLVEHQFPDTGDALEQDAIDASLASIEECFQRERG